MAVNGFCLFGCVWILAFNLCMKIYEKSVCTCVCVCMQACWYLLNDSR